MIMTVKNNKKLLGVIMFVLMLALVVPITALAFPTNTLDGIVSDEEYDYYHRYIFDNVAVDTSNDNFNNCTRHLLDESEDERDYDYNYKNVFVDGVVGLGYCSFGTLLIIVDANNFKILEAPEIASKSFKTVMAFLIFGK